MRSELAAKYGHKIKTVEELVRAVGPFPRGKRIIMCHGVFDVVHPGHLRHLVYAKSKADLLVVSITSDQHIDKGKYRPHVPHDLRAQNLAALEAVDFVIIDTNPNPLANVAAIKPDFFAKGYEYVASGMPQKTTAEAEVVAGYGGEMIFTPGDIVYSSSKLIEMAPPSIKLEKLLAVMDRFGLRFDDLRRAVDGLGGRRVHVVGDTIVDSLTETTLIGGQTKTPTLSVRLDQRRDFIGGAAIVAGHLAAAGSLVTFSTVLGDDPFRDFVLRELQRLGVDCDPVVDKTRPTTNKNAIVTDGYRLLKIDTVDNRTISNDVLERLRGSISRVATDCVVFSDFRHGIYNRRTIPALIKAIPAGVFRVADSQVASRWGNIVEFKGFDLITPNEREARFALGDQDSGVRPLASALYDAAECKTLILKLGDRGALTCRSTDHESLDSYFVVDSFVERLIDPVGAGDALLAYATLALMTTSSDAIATILGSIAAACACERDGNVTVVPDEVRAKIDHVERQCDYR